VFLVVPALRRVFVTATATDELVTLDERSYRVLSRTPTGASPPYFDWRAPPR